MKTTQAKLQRLFKGPYTGKELSDGFADPLEEEAALQEEADSFFEDDAA